MTGMTIRCTTPDARKRAPSRIRAPLCRSPSSPPVPYLSMRLPPGLVYLAERAHLIVSPPLLVYLLRRATAEIVNIPSWAIPLSLPALFTLSVLYTRLVNKLEARKRGAVLPPTTRDGTPGNILSLIRGISKLKTAYFAGDLFKTLEELGNTFNFRVLFGDRIFTVEPLYIKMVLATRFDEYEKGEVNCRILGSLFGTGVFNSDGDMWKFHRSMARPYFSKERVSDFDIFDSHADKAIDMMKSRLRAGHAVDFQDLVGRFTIDSATHFLFGKHVGTLDAGLPYPSSAPDYQPLESSTQFANRFLHAFQETQTISATRMRFGLSWPLYEFWKDQTLEHMEIIDDFMKPILQEAMANKTQVEKGDETLIQHLVNCTDDRTIMRDQLLNLLVAARDTTASTLTFVMYMLAEHPDVLERLREEIRNQVGPSARPTYDDIRQMKFLRAVINETLRLYPPVPFNVRTSKHANTWPSVTPGQKPFYLPPQTRIIYSDMAMHRRVDLWGPDALEWDPDRFLDDRVHKYLTPNPFIFLPFNAGPRICLGQQFAYNEASFFLIRFLQNFEDVNLALDVYPQDILPPPEWKSEPGMQAKDKLRIKAHVTMYVQSGLWVRAKEAEANESVL